MEKKYKINKNISVEVENRILFSIIALRDFGNVKAGDVGGYIEKEENLSHEGDCWIYDDACVYGDARVSGDVCILGNACVFENAHVSGNAIVNNDIRICGSMIINDVNQIFHVGFLGSRNDATYFIHQGNNILVQCGFFKGTIDEFEKKVKDTYNADNIFLCNYLDTIDYVKRIFEKRFPVTCC